MLLVLTPVAGAMSVAAYSVIGEKQARTLEPLLATPITTFELLAAKVLGAFLPGARAVARAASPSTWRPSALFARPGVVLALLTPRAAGACCSCSGRWRRCGAAAGGVRLVARQRSRAAPSRSARWSSCRSPAARRAAHGRLRGDDADHPADRRGVLALVNVGLMRLGVVALRSRIDPDAMEIDRDACSTSSAASPRVAVKHPRDAFVDDATIAAQWQAHGFTAAPDFARRADEYDAFRRGARQRRRRGASSCRADGSHDARFDLRPRRVARLRRRASCSARMGKPLRAAGAGGAGARVRGTCSSRRPASSARSSRRDCSRAATSSGSTTAPSPSGRGYRTNDEGIRQLRALLGDAIDGSSRCRCPTGAGRAT